MKTLLPAVLNRPVRSICRSLFWLLLPGIMSVATAVRASEAAALEHDALFSYAGSSPIGEGSRTLGSVTSFHARANITQARRLGTRDSGTTLLTGIDGQWLEFQAPSGSIVPRRLGATAATLGCEHEFPSAWIARAEIAPGIYSDFERSGGGFGAPLSLRLVHVTNPRLMWALAARIDWRSGTPVLGGLGVRWKFAPDWTLALLLPEPRIEWAVSPGVSLFAGASLRSGTFRLADDFGRRHGRPALDRQYVDYRELGAAAGVRWQASRTSAISLGVGRLLDRRFAFHERDLLLNGDGAATAQLTIASSF